MDFSTIKQKLAFGKYPRIQEFIVDVQLCFENCITYNGDGHELTEVAEAMTKIFQKEMEKLQVDAYIFTKL